MTDVIEYIKAHKGLPITSSKLSEAFGISGFEIRKMVNSARSEGCPICSCNRGYYYSENRDDIDKTILSLSHRIGSMQRAIKGLSMCYGGADEV